VNLRDAIGTALIGAFIGAMGILFWKAIPPSNEQLIVYMLGQLSGFVAGVVSFHYVTKSGEKELEQQRTENTGKALDAIKAAAETVPADHTGAAKAAEQVADAAVDEAQHIKGERP
jgi:hypothetical protein